MQLGYAEKYFQLYFNCILITQKHFITIIRPKLIPINTYGYDIWIDFCSSL